MQYGMKDEVEVRWQKRVEEVKCFRCWRIGHYKWKCPNIKVEYTNIEDLVSPWDLIALGSIYS